VVFGGKTDNWKGNQPASEAEYLFSKYLPVYTQSTPINWPIRMQYNSIPSTMLYNDAVDGQGNGRDAAVEERAADGERGTANHPEERTAEEHSAAAAVRADTAPSAEIRGGAIAVPRLPQPTPDASTSMSSSSDHSPPSSNNSKKRKDRTGHPKLHQDAVDYLRSWLLSKQHIEQPYTAEQTYAELQIATGLEKTQLKNWFV